MRLTPVLLGGHEFSMPAITLGSVHFGTKISKETAFSLMDYYAEQGGNWLDTARVYCVELIPAEERRPFYRDSEEIIGAWVRERKCRDKVTIITKGAHWSLQTGQKRVSTQAIRHDIELSLRKLEMDSTDIYFLHNDDETVSVEEIMPVMHEIVKSGKALVIGASNWRIQRIMEANAFAEKNSLTPFSISQVKWSYAVPTPAYPKPSIDMESDDSQYEGYCAARMPIMAYSSQARAFFIKAAQSLEPQTLGSAAGFLCEENIRRAEAVMRLQEETGLSVSSASLAYLWSRKVPVTALVGCATLEQLRSSMEDCAYIPDDHAAKLLDAARFRQ